jgi:hypothetical protein
MVLETHSSKNNCIDVCKKNKKRTYADTMTLIGTPDLQIKAGLLPTCLPVRTDAKHLVFMFVLL